MVRPGGYLVDVTYNGYSVVGLLLYYPLHTRKTICPKKIRPTITRTLEKRFVPKNFVLLLLAHSKGGLSGFIFRAIGFAEKRLLRVTATSTTGVAEITVAVTGVTPLGDGGITQLS